MRNVLNFKNELVALDGEHEFDLKWCYHQMKLWRQSYFRRNSVQDAEIMLRQKYEVGDLAHLTKNWLELSRGGKMVEQYRIKDEAYETLSRKLKEEEYPGRIVFVSLEKFTVTLS